MRVAPEINKMGDAENDGHEIAGHEFSIRDPSSVWVAYTSTNERDGGGCRIPSCQLGSGRE